MPEVQYLGFRTGLSLSGNPSFEGGCFKLDTSSASVDTTTGKSYPNVNGLIIHIPNFEPEHLQHALWVALERAELILVSIATRCKTYAFLERPIHCSLMGKIYFLHEDLWENKEEFERIHIIGGGSFASDAEELATPVDNSYSFYWAAQDRTLPVDYRALQAWRFLCR